MDYTFIRKYFEDGCLCIRDGIIDLKPIDISDKYAAKYYTYKCNCSRHWKHLEPEELQGDYIMPEGFEDLT
tara:strand:- start:49 stop:261 length:213 start_codon:yes stop_codon:yes gene_type:complete